MWETIKTWIKRDPRRFIWEVASVAFFASIGWGVNYVLNHWSHQVCQEEAEAMKQQWLLQQAEMDRIAYEGQLAEKDQLISYKDGEINDLRRKVASDSIIHLSDLAAVRAINQYINKGKAGGR